MNHGAETAAPSQPERTIVIRFLRALLFFWVPARKKAARSNSQRHVHTEPRFTRQQVERALDALDEAVAAARRNDFASVNAFLKKALPPLTATRTPYAQLRLRAAICLINALDANWGYAGRMTIETLRRLDAWRTHIDERAAQEIAAMCHEALRLVPLAKLGSDGAVANTFLHVARRLMDSGRLGDALLQLGRTEELARLSPALRHYPALLHETRHLTQQIIMRAAKKCEIQVPPAPMKEHPAHGTPAPRHLVAV